MEREPTSKNELVLKLSTNMNMTWYSGHFLPKARCVSAGIAI